VAAVDPGLAPPHLALRQLPCALALLDRGPRSKSNLAPLGEPARTLPLRGGLSRLLPPVGQLPCPLCLAALGDLARLPDVTLPGDLARALPLGGGSRLARLAPLRCDPPSLATLRGRLTLAAGGRGA
jgi:hypothetical protein